MCSCCCCCLFPDFSWLFQEYSLQCVATESFLFNFLFCLHFLAWICWVHPWVSIAYWSVSGWTQVFHQLMTLLPFPRESVCARRQTSCRQFSHLLLPSFMLHFTKASQIWVSNWVFLQCFCTYAQPTHVHGSLAIFGALPNPAKSLQMVTAAMKLKDACSLEEKLWPN